ncbi:MAG: hypothetical protein M3015_00345 [Bacteroidota bacterium]|nr:hypothetical protein [Bacteroidota bacterium]
MFGDGGDNLNSQYPYPVQFTRLICRRRKRNKTSVLDRVFYISIYAGFVIYDYRNVRGTVRDWSENPSQKIETESPSRLGTALIFKLDYS